MNICLIAVLGTGILCTGGSGGTQTVTVCPVIRQVDMAFQKRLAAEINALPPGTATEQMASEWLNLRDQARACEKLNKAKP